VVARPASQVQPLLEADFTHQSHRAAFGVWVRFFDNRLTVGPWLKVFKVPYHEVRLEAMVMPKPIGRSLRDWEAVHASLIQLRYRYGF
jgi:hypothetical protein